MTSQWRRARDRFPERRPALPIWPVELSNGEFLTRAGAVAATLGVLNACSSGGSEGLAPSTTGGPTTTARPTTTTSPPSTTTETAGGQYVVPEPEDEAACVAALADQGEFIFDIHTHHVMPDGVWRDNAPSRR